MTNIQPVRFAAIPSARSLALLAKNSRVLVGDLFYGKIHNIQNFKDNAFILSSLIQVASRIMVANSTARKAKDTPEGPYRYMEAVKTTFREAMGFFLSYIVLRAFQRGAVDFFRNFLCVNKGLSNAPTLFNPIFKRMFNIKTNLVPKVEKIFPTLFETIKGLGKQIVGFVTNKQEAIHMRDISKLFPSDITDKGVSMLAPGRQNYKKIEGIVNWIHTRLAGKAANASVEMKLRSFFDWVPPIIGSVPALLLSGLMLERYSQNHAEDLAQTIAAKLNRKKGVYPATPYGVGGGGHPGSGFPNRKLDNSFILSYANRQPNPLTTPGVMFNGNALPPGAQPGPSPWGGNYGDRPGHGSGASPEN